MVKPTIGRIVHYTSYGTPGGEYTSEPRAAIITQVHDDGSTVGLAVFNPSGIYLIPEIEHAEEPTPGRWSWPPRV